MLLSYRFSGNQPGSLDVGHPTADRLISLGEETGHVPFMLLGLVHRAWTLRAEGNLPEADRAMQTASALLDDQPAPIYAALFMLYRSSRLFMAGDLGGAEDAANEVLALGGQGFDATFWYAPAVMLIRAHQGRLAELVPLIEAGVDQPGLGPAYQAGLAAAYALEGRHDDALPLLEAFVADDLRAVPRNMLWFDIVICLAETAAILSHTGAARALRAQLRPYSGRIADVAATVVSTVDLALARNGAGAGRPHRSLGGGGEGGRRQSSTQHESVSRAGAGGPRPRASASRRR